MIEFNPGPKFKYPPHPGFDPLSSLASLHAAERRWGWHKTVWAGALGFLIGYCLGGFFA